VPRGARSWLRILTAILCPIASLQLHPCILSGQSDAAETPRRATDCSALVVESRRRRNRTNASQMSLRQFTGPRRSRKARVR
jgi:hypothetical protein